MRPARIADAVAAKVDKVRARHGRDVRIFVAYADCGTAGALDAYLEREGLDRIEGAHCFEFYAGAAAFEALQEEELGTFYLTDFLARQFDSIIWTRPRPRPASRAAARLLRQLPPRRLPRPERRPRPDRPGARRGRPSRARVRTPLDRVRRARLIHPPRRRRSRLTMATLSIIWWRDIPAQVVAKGGRSLEQDRPPPALPGRHRQGSQPLRKARVQLLHRRVAQDPDRLPG